MRTKRLTLLTFIFLAFLQLAFGQGNKHALIFAIGNYPSDSGWPTISSDNDTSLIKNALLAQNFFPEHIKVVHDKAATVKGISAALDEFVANANPGDIDVIHFSSHGEQIEDLKHHKADGLEECIVPYDARLPNPDKKRSSEYIKSLFPGYYQEELFGDYVNKLRAKLGKNGDLIVFLDCCHAGTGTRGSVKVRGGKGALVTPGFNLKPDLTTDLATAFSNSDDTNLNESNLATYVVFGAARSNELDYETVDEKTQIGYGSLSYAISKAFLNLTKAKNSEITYRALFAQIQAVMNDNSAMQHPVLAGNGADRFIFGGKVVIQKPFSEIDQIEGKHLSIKSGTLMGLDSGAKVAVYPAGTLDPKSAKFLDTGTVIKSGLFISEVQFNKPVSISQPADGWVFVTDPVFKNVPLKINVVSNNSRGNTSTPAFSESERLTIQKGLKTLPGVTFTGLPEITIVKGPKKDSILVAQTGLLFDTIDSASYHITELKTKISNYIQYTFLKSIIIRDTDALVSVKLIPMINGKPDSVKLKSNDKTYAFKDGEQVGILITNNSDQDLYINILDLQPNGQINPLLPNAKKHITPQQMLFTAGASKLFKSKISPPYGKEIFKIFVSTDLIDMEAIATTQGATDRGNMGVLERLVKKSYTTGTRGVDIDLADANGSTYNVAFDIVK